MKYIATQETISQRGRMETPVGGHRCRIMDMNRARPQATPLPLPRLPDRVASYTPAVSEAF